MNRSYFFPFFREWTSLIFAHKSRGVDFPSTLDSIFFLFSSTTPLGGFLAWLFSHLESDNFFSYFFFFFLPFRSSVTSSSSISAMLASSSASVWTRTTTSWPISSSFTSLSRRWTTSSRMCANSTWSSTSSRSPFLYFILFYFSFIDWIAFVVGDGGNRCTRSWMKWFWTARLWRRARRWSWLALRHWRNSNNNVENKKKKEKK